MYVYVFSAGNVQKVGITDNLERRRRQLEAASGRLLGGGFHGITPHARDVERAIHQMLRPYRVAGEWFEVSADIAEAAFDLAWKRIHGKPIEG